MVVLDVGTTCCGNLLGLKVGTNHGGAPLGTRIGLYGESHPILGEIRTPQTHVLCDYNKYPNAIVRYAFPPCLFEEINWLGILVESHYLCSPNKSTIHWLIYIIMNYYDNRSYFLLIHTFNNRSNLTICSELLDAILECKGSTHELMIFIGQPYWLNYNHLASPPPSKSKILSNCIQGMEK